VDAKKKTLHADERDTERVRRPRAAWRDRTSDVDPDRFIFVDESGCNIAMTRHHARAPVGQRSSAG